jgi:hypothetical protein
MNTMNNSHKVIAAAFSVLLMLLLTFSAALAKDTRSRTQSGPSSVSASGANDRGIIIVSGKGGKDASTTLDAKKIQQGIKINPGGPVELNPQPLPPKAFQQGIKINPGDAVGLNPQPLPPKAFQRSIKINSGDAVGLNP